MTSIRPGVSRSSRAASARGDGAGSAITLVPPAGMFARESWRAQFRYIVSAMSTSSLEPNEVRAAAELHRELDPEYRDAVVESFLDRVGKEIDARVDRRLAAAQPRPRTNALAIVSIV